MGIVGNYFLTQLGGVYKLYIKRLGFKFDINFSVGLWPIITDQCYFKHWGKCDAKKFKVHFFAETFWNVSFHFKIWEGGC